MKTVMATYTIPVTQNVIEIVESMARQFDAIGVKYQGLKKWKRTEPKTSTSSAITMAMARAPWACAPRARASANNATPGESPSGLPCVRQRGATAVRLLPCGFLYTRCRHKRKQQ